MLTKRMTLTEATSSQPSDAHNASRERRAREKQALRASILRAAGEVFLERGYEGLSMRSVAERIGYTATTIYLYFKDKDDLLFALLDEGYADLGQRLAQAAATERDPLQRLVAIGRTYITFGLDNPLLYQVMFMQRADFLAARLKQRPATRINAFDVLQQAVKEALDAGALKPGDVLTYALSLWAAVHGLVSLVITLPLTDAGLVERLIEISLAATLNSVRAAADAMPRHEKHRQSV
jgi:AcrR family transcriptional regulator